MRERNRTGARRPDRRQQTDQPRNNDMINAAIFGAGRIGKVHTHNVAGLAGLHRDSESLLAALVSVSIMVANPRHWKRKSVLVPTLWHEVEVGVNA
jgi:hypothetical protein